MIDFIKRLFHECKFETYTQVEDWDFEGNIRTYNRYTCKCGKTKRVYLQQN